MKGICRNDAMPTAEAPLGFWRGVVITFGIVAAFVLVGLTAAAWWAR
jgi:hypothetical protein